MMFLPTNSSGNLIAQLNQNEAQKLNPLSPSPFLRFDDVASLPDAADWPDCIALCADVGGSVPGLIYSDRTNWRRADTNATL